METEVRILKEKVAKLEIKLGNLERVIQSLVWKSQPLGPSPRSWVDISPMSGEELAKIIKDFNEKTDT